MDAQKKCWLYSERLGTKAVLTREEFLQEVALVPAHKRVYVDQYVDQSGVDDTLTYAWGWSRKGTPCPADRRGHKTARVSMMAALCQGQLLAPLTFQGTCYATLVESWFEHQLLPSLQEGQVVILDNAAFHRKDKLRAILAAKGCTLLALPPYSPDLNPIEHVWNTLKIRIALDTNLYPTFQHKVDAAFV